MKPPKQMLLLIPVLLFPALSSCGGRADFKTAEELKLLIYAVPNTVKVGRDVPCREEDRLPPEIRFEAAKNEKESAQLILCPEEEIRSYSISFSDLTGKSGRIKAKNITAYAQHYINVDVSNIQNYVLSNPGYPGLGYLPDGLIPLDKAAEKGENKIEAGKNQGLWFDISVPKNAKAGEYSGEALLTVNGERISLPLSLRVFDFALPEAPSSKSCFLIWDSLLLGTETDEEGELGKLYDQYVSALLDYRLNAQYLTNKKFENSDDYVALIKNLRKDQRINCMSLPLRTVQQLRPDGEWEGNQYFINVDGPYITELLVKLARASTEKLNLLEGIYMFPNAVMDEPSEANGLIPIAPVISATIMEARDNAVKQLGPFLADKPWLAKSLDEFQCIVTTGLPPVLKSGEIDTYCPVVNLVYDETAAGEILSYQASKYGIWTYTANIPPPDPTYHIEERLITPRAMSWIQKRADAVGLLSWCVNYYVSINLETGQMEKRELWNDPFSMPGNSGEGYLFYPGRDYGIEGPIPTIRLASIREGMDDFDYLTILDSRLEALSTVLGQSFSADILLEKLYASILDGTRMTSSMKNFSDARRDIAEMIELLSTPAMVLFTEKPVEETGEILYEIFTGEGVKLKNATGEIEGVQKGRGLVFNVPVSVEDAKKGITFTFTKGGKSFTVTKRLNTNEYIYYGNAAQ